jgi:hypothetical protein
MAMILTIDTLAERYGMLPSEAMLRGSTFDLYVMDAAISYHNYQRKKAMNNGVAPAVDYSQEEMVNLLKGARNG